MGASESESHGAAAVCTCPGTTPAVSAIGSLAPQPPLCLRARGRTRPTRDLKLRSRRGLVLGCFLVGRLCERQRFLLCLPGECLLPPGWGRGARQGARGCCGKGERERDPAPLEEIQSWGIPDLTAPTGSPRLGPKRAGRIRQLFYRSRTDAIGQYVVSKPLRKEGKKLWTKAPKLQPLLIPQVLPERLRLIALKKQRTQKDEEEAAEDANLLAKRLKKANKTHQETRANIHRLSSLRTSVSTLESRKKSEIIKI
uniref:Small ribosomal subunit protein eS6 n=1 Tax=Chrysemys picta bellii TaxID=8478 RepID=A0A8C3P9Q2_CHRPI